MGGYSAPAQPQQPSTADAVNAWVNAMPQVYQTQLQYAPLQAQQQVELAQQYAQPLGQAMQTAQSAMYPQTTALQENLAGQAAAGMSSDVPDWMKQQYQSNMNAQLGTNANSPIGADYMSRGLLQQQQDWKQYYQNLGLSVTGRQPLNQAQAPSTSDYMSNFSPNANMGFMANTYGTAGNIYGSQLQAQSASNSAMMNLIGAGIGAGGAAGGGYLSNPMAFMSSARYKRNIKLWLAKPHLN